MQVFKRVNNKYKKGQNLIEFIFILPILIFLTLAIFEVALFWQDVNAIYNLNAEINASVALIDPRGMSLGDTEPCEAAKRAQSILEKRGSMISINNPTYTMEIAEINGVTQGDHPFALYHIYGGSKITGYQGVTNPQIQLWVDCRAPFEEGVTTQLEFYHKTLIMKASIPRFVPSAKSNPTEEDKKAITIIPDNIFIASPKLNTIRQY